MKNKQKYVRRWGEEMYNRITQIREREECETMQIDWRGRVLCNTEIVEQKGDGGKWGGGGGYDSSDLLSNYEIKREEKMVSPSPHFPVHVTRS